MPLLDISKVSETLKTLIKTHVETSPAWPQGTALEVSLEPPDKLNGNGQEAIGLYLYHLSEDPHYKNTPAPGSNEPPIRYTPMGLNLFYQLSAHSGSGVLNEQRMMGLAVKALRDYPVIDDTTKIPTRTGDDVEILSGDLRDEHNRFKIVLQPMDHNQAVSYWTAGSTPLRLATYYQVAVVLLEPEETWSRSGRVLLYGVHAFVAGSPRLDYSTNNLSYTYLDESTPRQLELRPAQVPFDGEVAFVGSSLTGDKTQLILRSPFWDEEGLAGTNWGVSATAERVSATVRDTVETKQGPVDVWPGTYSAFLRVISHRTQPDGSRREFEHTSNQTPFVVAPRIEEIVEADHSDPAGIVTVNLWVLNGFDSSDTADPAKEVDVEVYVGDMRLERIPVGTPGYSQFVIDDERTLRLVRPSDIASQQPQPLRIFVNGAESPPNWVVMP